MVLFHVVMTFGPYQGTVYLIFTSRLCMHNCILLGRELKIIKNIFNIRIRLKYLHHICKCEC